MEKKVDLKLLREEIYKIAKESKIKLNHRALNEYLLGDCLTCGVDTREQIIYGKRKISKENKNIIFHEGVWKRENFRNKVLLKGSFSLFEKKIMETYSEFAEGKEFEELMKALVYQAIFHTQFPMIFPEYRKKTCEGYIPWNQKEQELQEKINKNNIVILRGGAGVGKTQLVKSFLQKRQKTKDAYEEISWNELVWFNEHSVIAESIEERLEKIEEYDELEPEQWNQEYVADKIRRLKVQSENTLLVLECPVLSETDYEFLIRNFDKRDIRIIVMTRKCPEDIQVPIVEYPVMPKEVLCAIFKRNLGTEEKSESYYTEEEFSKLLTNVDSNTLTIVLLAKMIKNKKESFFSIKNDLLDIYKWIRCKGNFTRVNEKAYTEVTSSYNPVFFIQSLLDKYCLIPYKDEKAYAEMALWAKYEVPITNLREWVKSEWTYRIDEFVEMGILEYQDQEKTVVKMPGIVADAIWFKWQIEYKEYREELKEFVIYLCIGQNWYYSYSMIYKIMWNLIFRFCFLLDRDESLKRRKEWWEFVSIMVEKFVQMGNANMAKRILSMMSEECANKVNKNKLLERKTEEVLKEQIDSLNIICLEIQAMESGNPLELLTNPRVLLNPKSMQKVCVLLIKWAERKMELSIVGINDRNGQKSLQEDIEYFKKLIGMYWYMEEFIKREYNIKEDVEFEENSLYFKGILYSLKAYLGTVCGRHYKKAGYQYLEKCKKIAEDNNDTEWMLRVKIKIAYLKVYYSLLTGEIEPGIHVEMKKIKKRVENELCTWELTLLYQKTSILYAMYRLRGTDNIDNIVEKIHEFVNVADDQIDALTKDAKDKLKEVEENSVKETKKYSSEFSD